MTFKHVKFEDSATMRSLIKVAAEKGWVKNNPLEKYASVEREDLTPTDSLTENVMKLCAGLRSQGMDKYADELGNKFVAYKKAAGIYNVSGETGEDLVDAAHPDGGHKMEDMLGDSLIETILERHLKMVEVINKKPHGKLASHADILSAVKIVVSGDVSKIQASLKKVLSNVNAIFALHEQQNILSRPIVQGKDTLRELINSAITNAGNAEMAEGLCYQIKSGLDSFHSAFKPGWAFGGSSEEVWGGMQPAFNAAYNALALAQKLLGEPDAPVAPAVVKKPLDDLLNQATSLKNKVQSWKSIGSIIKQPLAVKWIDSELASLEDIISRYKAVPAEQQANLVNALSKELNAEVTDINQFEAKWVTG